MLTGKTALVTGSTSGIGLGIARALSAQGANIILNGFGAPEQIDAARASLEANGTTARYHGADLSQGPAITQMFAEVGPVDILVNNAGIQHVAPIASFPDDRWDLLMRVNLSAVFFATKLVLPHMQAQQWGRIINIASAHGLRASPFKSAYVAAKHGVIGLTKVTALEMAEQGVTCNAICPGYVDTPLVRGQIADQAKLRDMSEQQVIREVILAKQPTKAFVKVEELAALTVFLCSNAADSITGAALSVDGGWTAE